jgi:hypothetical protein
MKQIDLGKISFKYNKETKTFSVSEKDVPFDTSYEVIGMKTGETKQFELSHSTGPEFDPNTRWVYKCDDMVLEVCNDAEMTKIAAANYLKGKLR